MQLKQRKPGAETDWCRAALVNQSLVLMPGKPCGEEQLWWRAIRARLVQYCNSSSLSPAAGAAAGALRPVDGCVAGPASGSHKVPVLVPATIGLFSTVRCQMYLQM